MPIIRTYGCNECGHIMEVQLRADEWDAPEPDCPACSTQTRQEFKPPAIGGSHRSRATDLAHQIAREDYGVSDIQSPSRAGPSVRYHDQSAGTASTWMGGGGQLQQAMALGRQTRLQHGNGLDVLHNALKSGAQPDLIELSKRRSAKVW